MKFSALSVSALALLAPAANAFAFSPTPSTSLSTHATRSTELYSEVERNANFAKLAGGYLFPEIGRRRNAYLEANPEMKDRIISLGTCTKYLYMYVCMYMYWNWNLYSYYDYGWRLEAGVVDCESSLPVD